MNLLITGAHGFLKITLLMGWNGDIIFTGQVSNSQPNNSILV